MIKLEKGNPPSFLTDAKKRELTDLFLQDEKRRVWAHDDIRIALLEEGFGKCAYCETSVDIGASTLHVDHYKPKNKDAYPELVVDWDNLIPACQRCNTKKGTKNTGNIEILNPFTDDPKEHLVYSDDFFAFKTPLGRTTRAYLGLNDDRPIKDRSKITMGMKRTLLVIYEESNMLSKYEAMSALLDLCLPENEYSVAKSTVIHCNEFYNKTRELLIANNFWSEELEDKHLISRSILLN